MFWELPEVSLLGTIRVFCSIAESLFGCAIFPRTLRSLLWLFTYCVWDVLRYRILIKTALSSWGKRKNSKTTLSTFQKFFLSSGGLVALVVTKKAVLRTSADLCTWNKTCFLFNCRVTFWLRYFSPNATFGTLALYILRLRCLAIPNTWKETAFVFFSETWSSSFWNVCNCFDDFRTNRPKNTRRSHRKENTNFAKWRWVRSKNVCLSSALVFSLVVTKKYDLRTSWGLSTWNKTCFLFRCRVTFRPGKFSNATFGTLALYILRLRCLGISNTYKNSFCSLSKTETFQNDVVYVPEMSFWALLGWILWL